MSNVPEQEAQAKKEAYEKLLEQYTKEVATWADFFALIHKKMKAFGECGCPMHMSDALFTMYAFIITMEECPQEGDINKLCEHMVRLMIYESQQKLGLTVNMLTSAEQDRVQNVAALASQLVGGNLLRMMTQKAGESSTDADGTVADSEGKKHPKLH